MLYYLVVAASVALFAIFSVADSPLTSVSSNSVTFDELNEENYILFAIKYYDNPQAVTQDDFFEDLSRFKYIKKLLRKYVRGGELRVDLLINHFIIIFNVFNDAAVPLLFYKLERELWSSIKTFLLFLNRIPEYPKSMIDDIPIDHKCLDILNSI
jgi:hypothetical protein